MQLNDHQRWPPAGGEPLKTVDMNVDIKILSTYEMKNEESKNRESVRAFPTCSISLRARQAKPHPCKPWWTQMLRAHHDVMLVDVTPKYFYNQKHQQPGALDSYDRRKIPVPSFTYNPDSLDQKLSKGLS